MKLSKKINIEIEEYIVEKLKYIQHFSIFEIWVYGAEEGLTLIQKDNYKETKYFFKRVCLNNMLYNIDVEKRNIYRVLAYNEDEKMIGIILDFKDL